MPTHEFQLSAILQRLENDTFLSEGLFFPEVSTLGDGQERSIKVLERMVRRLSETDDLSKASYCFDSSRMPSTTDRWRTSFPFACPSNSTRSALSLSRFCPEGAWASSRWS